MENRFSRRYHYESLLVYFHHALHESDLAQNHLTNRSSQPLAVVKSTFDFMKQFLVFATLALTSGGSASSR
jgi:hypothetical protein